MVDAFIRSSLGNFGNAVLDFYLENALWINGLILLYALVVALGNIARQKMNMELRHYLTEAYGENLNKKSASWFRKNFERNEPDWNRLLNATWIPILSRKGAFSFKLKSIVFVKEVFTPEYIAALFLE